MWFRSHTRVGISFAHLAVILLFFAIGVLPLAAQRSFTLQQLHVLPLPDVRRPSQMPLANFHYALPKTSHSLPDTGRLDNVTAQEKPPQFVIFTGKVRHNTTGAPLEGIAVDVYRELPGGGEETVLLKSFLNGQIRFSLQRGYTYRIVVKKSGFFNETIRVLQKELADANIISYEFLLPVASSADSTL